MAYYQTRCLKGGNIIIIIIIVIIMLSKRNSHTNQ